MLVISRYREQVVYIGDARVKILGVAPDGRVKLGIEAPQHVGIWREEALQRLWEEVGKVSPDEVAP